MSKIRVGFSSDWNIKGNNVGFGTANPTASLHVVDTLKADFNITGVATLTAYGGFVAQNQHVTEPSKIGIATVGVGTFQQYYETETGFTDLGGVHHGDDQYYNTLSEDLVIDDGQILNITDTDMVGVTTIGEYDPHSHSSYVCAGSLEQVSVTGHFSVPNGGSNDRKDNPIEGTVRFNDDLNTLEFFNGNEWRQFTYNQGQSGRAIVGSSADGGREYIESYNITTTGNTTYFGDLFQTRSEAAGFASNIRGLFAGGSVPTATDTIDYITIASEGNAIDFGDRTDTGYGSGAVSSSTRGVMAGGWSPGTPRESGNTEVIDYVEISTVGGAVDFGDLKPGGTHGSPGLSSPTRGLFGGGYWSTFPSTTSPYQTSFIGYITISSKGNTIKFGDLTNSLARLGALSNSTRGLFAGGYQNPGPSAAVNTIQYVTIASEGNAQDFGNLTVARATCAGTSTNIRGVFNGGGAPTSVNVIDYVTIMSAGNAIDFGDLTDIKRRCGATSDSHGGLGGF